MAVWQFTIELIPKAWIGLSGKGLNDLFFDDGYETSATWHDHQPSVDIDALITNVLAPAPSWHSEIRCWGDEEETDIQVSYSNGQVESVRIRIDARQKVGAVCSKIVEVANSLECVFFAPESKSIIHPVIFDLARAISQSGAGQFAANPKAFIEELRIDRITED